METVRQDARYAWRSIRRTPLASGVIVATLAVGICLVTTFFSLVNAAFYRPLPYPGADRTISLTYYYLARRPVEELAKITRSIERITLFQEHNANLVTPLGAYSIKVGEVDSSFFKLLGVAPVLGTLPSAQSIQERDPFVVINERLWRSRFGGAADIVGTMIEIDGVRRPIVAVMPAWFTYRERAQAWMPLVPSTDLDAREYTASALLRPGATVEDVQREADLVGSRLMQVDRKIYRTPRHSYLMPMSDMVDRGRGRGAIMAVMVSLVLGGAVAVLLVACTNVASLMLARVARRRSEMGLRAALGGSRWQLIRPQLVESLMLAAMAWALGTVLSHWSVRLLLATVPANLPGWTNFGTDWRVLGFAALASLATVLVFGLWPAHVGTRLDLSRLIRGADHAIAGGDPTRRLHLPVVLELTLSLALFVGAALALSSLRELASLDRGLTLDGRYHVRVAMDPNRDSTSLVYADYVMALRRELSRSSATPIVAATGRFAGLRGDTGQVPSVVVTSTKQALNWEHGDVPSVVSDGYFKAVGIRILAGRSFDSTDAQASAPVAVVSRAFAIAAWGTDQAVGKTLDVKAGGRRATVIGIASDIVTNARLVEGRVVPGRNLYFGERQAQIAPSTAEFITSTSATPSAVSDAFAAAAAKQGRTVPVFVRTYREEIEGGNVAAARMLSMILGTFAAAGLVLAIMGIYGVVAFAVEQRTREIGVRVALGASTREVITHMMGGGMRLVAIGLVLGLLGAAVEARLLSTMLFTTKSSMVLAGIAAAAVFAGIAAVACYLPARHSTSIDPLAALRAE